MVSQITALNLNRIFVPKPGQQEFVDQFLREQSSKSLLVAAPGTGKTTTALFAASKMLSQGVVDSLLVISDRVVVRDQWSEAAKRYGIELETSFKNHLSQRGASITLQSLLTKSSTEAIEEAGRARRWLIIADDTPHETDPLVALVDRMLSFNDSSKALFISRFVPGGLSFDSEFRFGSELILDRSILDAPATEIRVARFAPSFSLLRQLQNGSAAIDEMSWRDFERLIAALLERDGYTVELMDGTKDGGVDVMATKNLGPSGYFRTLWQAKKKNQSNKVGISVVRELADTRQEFGASKGIIVTSSYLTRGAIERINRDKFILGKVDRRDLDAWIRRTFFGEGIG
jgi:restriction system protein